MIGKLLRERVRNRAVANLSADGTLAEPHFDRFVEQAALAFAAPFALLNLIRGDQLLVQASRGIEPQCMPRKDSFCTHGIDHAGAILEVCDATADPVFGALPSVVGPPYARYYIGAPLALDGGIDVGMLCVVDVKARAPASRDQRAYLVGLARQAAAALGRNAEAMAA